MDATIADWRITVATACLIEIPAEVASHWVVRCLQIEKRGVKVSDDHCHCQFPLFQRSKRMTYFSGDSSTQSPFAIFTFPPVFFSDVAKKILRM